MIDYMVYFNNANDRHRRMHTVVARMLDDQSEIDVLNWALQMVPTVVKQHEERTGEVVEPGHVYYTATYLSQWVEQRRQDAVQLDREAKNGK